MRLDLYLVATGHAPSRENAKHLIEEGRVLLDGKAILKPAKEITGEPQITVIKKQYVGRGGEKMAAALDLFGIDPTGWRILDIGASTGGFTDCLLQRGAAFAVAVDAGSGQLHGSLVSDPRVQNIEK